MLLLMINVLQQELSTMSAVLTENDPWSTASQVAHLLGCHPSAVIRWIKRGTVLSGGARLRLEASAIPGGWRIQKSALDRFVEALTADLSRPVEEAAPTPRRPDRARLAAMDASLQEQGFSV
jgi:hypothetical protein